MCLDTGIFIFSQSEDSVVLPVAPNFIIATVPFASQLITETNIH